MKKRLALIFFISFAIFSTLNVIALNGADFAIYTGSGTWQPSIIAFEKFLEWYDNKEKQAEGVLPYGIYRLEWVEGKEDPKWIQFYEGCLNNLR